MLLAVASTLMMCWVMTTEFVTRFWSDSEDGRKNWSSAKLGEDHGPYSFRTWEAAWTPKSPGKHTVAVRATDEKGNVQPDEPVWNPGGYLWNRIEKQELFAGIAG